MMNDLMQGGNMPSPEKRMTFDNHIALYNLEEKNRRVEAAIARAAIRLAGLKIGLGIMGNLVPFGTIFSTAAGVAVQGPKILTPLVSEIASIYNAQTDKHTGKLVDVGVYAAGTADFLSEFGTLLALDLAAELSGEVLAVIPVVGVGVDVALSTAICWQCGVLAALYFNNGQAWIGDRHTTFIRAKVMTGGLNPTVDHRVNLNDVRSAHPEVRASQTAHVQTLISMMRAVNPRATTAEIRVALAQQRIPHDIIDYALACD